MPQIIEKEAYSINDMLLIRLFFIKCSLEKILPNL